MQQTLLNLAQKYDKKYINYCKKFENICEQIYNKKVIKAMISPQTTQDSSNIIFGFFIFSKTFYYMKEADLSNFFANLESKKESQISHFLNELMQGILQFLNNYLSFLNALESNIKMLKVYMLGYNYFCKFEIVNFNFCFLAKLFSHNILDDSMLDFCPKMLIFWDVVDEMIMSDISCDIDGDEFKNIELEIVKNRGAEYRKFIQNTDFTSKDSIKKGFILYVKKRHNPNIGRWAGDRLKKDSIKSNILPTRSPFNKEDSIESNLSFKELDKKISKKDSKDSKNQTPTHHPFNKEDSIESNQSLGFKNLKDFKKYKHNVANLIFIESNLCETFKRKKSLKSRQKILQTSQFCTLYNNLNLQYYSKDSILKHYKTFSLFLWNLVQELFW